MTDQFPYPGPTGGQPEPQAPSGYGVTPPPPVGAYSAGYPYSYSQQPQNWPPAYPAAPKKGMRTGTIVGLVLGLAALAFAAMFIAPFLLLKWATSGVDDSIDNLTGGKTEQILADQLDVTIGEFTVENNGSYVDTSLEVTFYNKGDERETFRVEIEAVNSDGDRIETDYISVEHLDAGQSSTEVVFDVVDENIVDELESAEFRVISVSTS